MENFADKEGQLLICKQNLPFPVWGQHRWYYGRAVDEEFMPIFSSFPLLGEGTKRYASAILKHAVTSSKVRRKGLQSRRWLQVTKWQSLMDNQSPVETYHLAENNLRGILRQVWVKSAWSIVRNANWFSMLPKMAEALLLCDQVRVWLLWLMLKPIGQGSTFPHYCQHHGRVVNV